jgi:hypothetical protein
MAILFDWNSYDQFLTTAGTTTPNNGLAVLALHPGTKAVSSFSANPAGLIGSLGHFYLLCSLFLSCRKRVKEI